ncbi:MAG: hypothetical protein K0B14_18105, partial [Anaerolineaceae bacterium]|nr:hypothetical protein [Anaerolineaceae bacterium]
MLTKKFLSTLIILTCILSPMSINGSERSIAQAEPRSEDYVFRRSWGGEGDQLSEPRDVAIGPDGRIYILSGDYVVIFQPNDRTFTGFGGRGTGEGQFTRPFGIVVDGIGNVYVADSENNRVQKFSADGDF